jgi:hypothetical protein
MRATAPMCQNPRADTGVPKKVPAGEAARSLKYSMELPGAPNLSGGVDKSLSISQIELIIRPIDSGRR